MSLAAAIRHAESAPPLSDEEGRPRTALDRLANFGRARRRRLFCPAAARLFRRAAAGRGVSRDRVEPRAA